MVPSFIFTMDQERIDKYIQSFDELNVLAQNTGEEDRADVAETLLVMAYKRGREDTEDDLDYFLDTDSLDKLTGDLESKVYEKTDGKTFIDRISDGLSKDEYSRLIETEYHRVYNESAMRTAESIERATGRSLSKTWRTVQDNRVRATHEPLEGVTKALNEKFYTIDGDEARFPGGFQNAANNINCRCLLEFK